MIYTSINLEGKTKKVGSNTIVINGKHYDAKTGRLLENAHHGASHTSTPHKQNGATIDGFSHRSTPKTPAHSVHSKNEKSKTLMRGAVKKPLDTKIHAKTVSHHNPRKSPLHNNQLPGNSNRAIRAANTAKSSLISRFGAPLAPPIPHRVTAHLPVAPAPDVSVHNSAPIITRSGIVNPFQTAIDNATSHTQKSPKLKKRHKIAKALRITPKMASFGSFVLAGMLLGGFFVYQNIPNLAMRVASARSGVSASVPGYRPAGFAMNGPIQYSPGKITISFQSNSDDRSYQVTQSNSEWNSETLLDKFVAVDRKPYQTYQDKGKTIYIYSDNNATWVDEGVWYQVEGKSSLNSNQLLRIANSL